jgi:hypothetical protein
MAWYDTKITCPKCLRQLDSEILETDTSYGCWSGEEVSVGCYECGFDFEVRCDHAGYTPRDDFDIESFLRAHKVKIPQELARVYVTHYFSEFVTGSGHLVTSKEYPDENQRWKDAYEFARKEWERIQAELHGKEDDDFAG